MDNEEYKNLVILLNMFKNRPHHLAKYLIENSAITEDFIKKLKYSEKLKKISNENDTPYFTDISKMDEFYNSFIDDIKQLSKEKGIEEVTRDLNKKLYKFILQEKFEEAAKLRDYMSRNNIKRNF